MSGDKSLSQGVLIICDRIVVYASRSTSEFIGFPQEGFSGMQLNQLLLFFSPADAKRIERLIRYVESGKKVEPQKRICLHAHNDRQVLIDLILSSSIFQGKAAVEMVWVISSPEFDSEAKLLEENQRLQILHDLGQSILKASDAKEAADLVLRKLSLLTQDYHSSRVVLIKSERNELRQLSAHPEYDSRIMPNRLSILGIDPTELALGFPIIVRESDLNNESNLLFQELHSLGVRGCLHIPLRLGEEIGGLLTLNAASNQAISVENVGIVQEMAVILAGALQQNQLISADNLQRREAEAMRDVMSALAAASDINQALQAVLVNLHNVIEYDRASLYLLDENRRFLVSDETVEHQTSSGLAFDEKNALIVHLRDSPLPILVADIQQDQRFSDWPEVQTVRGWLGAPLRVGKELIGFISLGSLIPDSYDQEDSDRLQAFAEQVALVLERAWLREQSKRRAEELEVLSSVTLALGRAESEENTLFAMLSEIARFSGAQSGVILLPDRLETNLVVKASLDNSLLGLSFPSRWDPLWNVYIDGEPTIIKKIERKTKEGEFNSAFRLFRNAQTVILVPIKTGGGVFGVLGFGFESETSVDDSTLRLCSAVTEVSAGSLRRAVVLESLEKQIDLRTQHLATLYDINSVASEPREISDILERILTILLDSMKGIAGSIHFMDERKRVYRMVVQKGLSDKAAALFQDLHAQEGFWEKLSNSSNPVVINDTASEPSLPDEFYLLRQENFENAMHLLDTESQDLISAPILSAYIGAPIRAKGEPLGLLSLFDASILDFTIEDLTLFMTVADQIGGLVERSRLMKQAEIAAVVQERQRLARDLHDSVTQLLYSQVLFSGAGLKVLDQGQNETAVQHLDRIHQGALQALREMRLLVYQLRPADLLDEGLIGALTHRLDSVERRTGIDAHLIQEGQLSLPESIEMTLYRIAEEALNNTLKHAQASSVTIILRATDSRVILEIQDNGIGFDPEEPTNRSMREAGMGLLNIRERTAALGGTFEIHSNPGEGTKLIIQIEVQDEQDYNYPDRR